MKKLLILVLGSMMYSSNVFAMDSIIEEEKIAKKTSLSNKNTEIDVAIIEAVKSLSSKNSLININIHTDKNRELEALSADKLYSISQLNPLMIRVKADWSEFIIFRSTDNHACYLDIINFNTIKDLSNPLVHHHQRGVSWGEHGELRYTFESGEPNSPLFKQQSILIHIIEEPLPTVPPLDASINLDEWVHIPNATWMEQMQDATVSWISTALSWSSPWGNRSI